MFYFILKNFVFEIFNVKNFVCDIIVIGICIVNFMIWFLWGFRGRVKICLFEKKRFE